MEESVPVYWQESDNKVIQRQARIEKKNSAREAQTSARERTQSERKSIRFADVDEVAEFDRPFETIKRKEEHEFEEGEVELSAGNLKKLLAHGLLTTTFIDALFDKHIKLDKAQFHKNLLKVRLLSTCQFSITFPLTWSSNAYSVKHFLLKTYSVLYQRKTRPHHYSNRSEMSIII